LTTALRRDVERSGELPVPDVKTAIFPVLEAIKNWDE
jgi:hypothetical protein